MVALPIPASISISVSHLTTLFGELEFSYFCVRPINGIVVKYPSRNVSFII